jgi:hypothetical protein
VGLEQGTLSLVTTIEDLLGRKSRGTGLESREYGRKDPNRLSRDTHYPQRLALTSPTSGGHSVGIGHSRTEARELFFSLRQCGPTRGPLIHFVGTCPSYWAFWKNVDFTL